MGLMLTKSGYENYQKEIKKKEEELRQLGIYKGKFAVWEGNVWHDNFAFEQTEIQERALIYTISQMKQALASATIIEDEPSSNNNDTVVVNSKVHVKLNYSNDDCEELHLTLSGDVSGKLDENTISINSPLGSCIFGKKVGFVGNYCVNGKNIKVTIIDIE